MRMRVSAPTPRRSVPSRDARKRAAVYLPITSRQLADGTVEIAPSGEIDLDNAHVMRDAVNDALGQLSRRGSAWTCNG